MLELDWIVIDSGLQAWAIAAQGCQGPQTAWTGRTAGWMASLVSRSPGP